MMHYANFMVKHVISMNITHEAQSFMNTYYKRFPYSINPDIAAFRGENLNSLNFVICPLCPAVNK